MQTKVLYATTFEYGKKTKGSIENSGTGSNQMCPASVSGYPIVFSLSHFFLLIRTSSPVNQQFEFGAICDYSIPRFSRHLPPKRQRDSIIQFPSHVLFSLNWQSGQCLKNSTVFFLQSSQRSWEIRRSINSCKASGSRIWI
jgi:hypothetical protein